MTLSRRLHAFRPDRTTVFKTIGLAAAYVAGAKIGLALAFSHSLVTSVWPPTGIAVAALMIWGTRVWPGIFIGAFVANVLSGAGIPIAVGIAVGNTIAPVVAVAFLRKWNVRPTFDRLRDVVVFATTGMLAMTISATLGTIVLKLGGRMNGFDAWRIWWMGDAMGVLLVAPLLLVIFSKSLRASFIVQHWRKATLLLGAFAVVTVAAVQPGSPAGFVVIPLALFVAMQLEVEGAAAAALIMSVIDIWHTTVAPIAGTPVERQLMGLQGVNATIALILLSFAAVMRERRRTAEALRASADDLEERVRSRTEDLHMSEQRFAEAQRLARIGSFQWDAATDTNVWSEELYRIYGLDPNDGPPGFEEYLSFVRPDKFAEVRTDVERAIATGEAIGHEYPVVLKDGTKKWVHAYVEVLKDGGGNLAGLRGTCQDVSERIKSEEALRSSEHRFRTLLESAPDAVVVVDDRGTIVLMNEQTSELFGYEHDELIGKCVDSLLPSQLSALHSEHRFRFAAQPSRRPMGAGQNLFAQKKDGSLVPVDISLSPVETDTGFLVFALVRDASERRRVETALRTALEREQLAAEDLRKLDQAKNAFLSAVSHELRTPLTAIIGFTELLGERDVRESEEMVTGLVDRLGFSANRLADLLSDLLDIDRLHRGILEPRRRRAVLRDLVERALAGLDVGKHSLQVVVDDAEVCVDPAQVERIVENLVSNAVKYTPKGTDIFVSAFARDDDGVTLAVTDHGPGVPVELREKIFESFVRGDTGSFTPGTGIGLALVDRFAKLHGGRVWIEEPPGGGATFNVELPGPSLEGLEAAVA